MGVTTYLTGRLRRADTAAETAPAHVAAERSWRARNGGTFAAGADGIVLRREGRAWVREATGSDADLRALAVDAHGVLWAAGNDGVLLRREAGGWTVVAVPDIEGGGLCRANLTSLAVLGDTLVAQNDVARASLAYANALRVARGIEAGRR